MQKSNTIELSEKNTKIPFWHEGEILGKKDFYEISVASTAASNSKTQTMPMTHVPSVIPTSPVIYTTSSSNVLPSYSFTSLQSLIMPNEPMKVEDSTHTLSNSGTERFPANAESALPLKFLALSPVSTESMENQVMNEPPIEHPHICPFVGTFGDAVHCMLCLDSSEAQLEVIWKSVKDLHSVLRTVDAKERQKFIAYLGNKEDPRLMRMLLTTLESCSDPALIGSICGFLHDCLNPVCDGGVRLQLVCSLVSFNAAEVLFRAFKNLPPNVLSKGDSCILHGFQIIAKLSSKDSKLAVKCRLVGGVKFTHQLIQTHSKNNSLLLPLLVVLKFIAKNPTNQIVLGKDGCVVTLISILNSVPKTHWAKIKLVLETLALLTKTTSVSPRLTATIQAGGQKLQALLNCFFESNVIRLVRENGLLKILALLDSWEKIDRKQQTKVLRALLCVLSHLCDSKHGRKAVITLNGIDILHRFVVSCPSDSKFETLLGSALNVFLKCACKGELPVASQKGAITFQFPSSDTISIFNAESRDVTPDPDQETSDEEEEAAEEDETRCDLKGVDLTTVYNPQTTRLEDLMRMANFFPEFQNNNAEITISARNFPCITRKGENCPASADELFLNLSSATKSLISFVKVAYPDMMGAEGPPILEPLHQKNPKVSKEKALRTVDRVLNADSYQEKVVFDLDYLLESEHTRQLITPTVPPLRSLSNWDDKRVGKKDVCAHHLNFESRFECGNLRRAIQVAPFEYDLLLNSDVNSWHHHQWFYFEISNMDAGVPYILNIINNEKPNSEFNFGMKPVIFSVKESQLGRCFWVRTGYDICYHKNHFNRFPKTSENSKFKRTSGKSYYTVSMTVKFPHSNDVVYLAYHYPYTFTKLQSFLTTVELDPMPSDLFFCNQVLCQTLNGNPLPVITITSRNRSSREKETVFLTARVHPGESNSSWVMQGTIKFLVGSSDEACALRNNFIFKIVPMLNPEGVIHGNQRCGLTDEDLNRRWRSPNPSHHPTIYYTKALIEHLTAVVGKRPFIFCDFHGHSRQKNVFMYGCSRQQSWWPHDRNNQDDENLKLLPQLAQLHMLTFSLRDCRYHVERAKEATARVAVWRQFRVNHSFTMEASTCGCDQGPYKNYHLSPKLLLESGEGFCMALYHLGCQGAPSYEKIINDRLANTKSFANMTSTNLTLDEEHKNVDLEEDSDFDSDEELDYHLYGTIKNN